MSPGNDTTCETLTSLSLHTPTIPFDLVPEILCRLPVKFLLQLKCVCKSWKTLISDPKFAKKHLHMSKMYHHHHHHHLIVTASDSLLWDSTTSSIFSDTSTTSAVPQLQLKCPTFDNGYGFGFDGLFSCDGILLFAIDGLLWNPSTRKSKILPPLLNPELLSDYNPHYTFGYDHFIDNYKVFAITSRPIISVTYPIDFSVCTKRELSVYILGTDSWRRVDDFQYDRPHGLGIFMSGSVNWLTFGGETIVIVSLDLENESYQTLSMPDLRKYHDPSTLGVFRDWLGFLANDDVFFDVWVMKEYGIKESWTKLFSIPYVRGDPSSFANAKVVYVSEDDQVLLDYKELLSSLKVDSKLVVYNSRNGTFKIPRIRKINCLMVSKVYVESLISPCP